jgi:hypothetical protein
MSKPTTLRLALLVLALGLVAAACGTTDDSGQEATTTTTVAAATTTTPATTTTTEPMLPELTLDVTGFPELANAAHYENWAIIDGAPVSAGKFNVVDGAIVDLDGASISDFPVAGLEAATTIVVTIEPAGDRDAVPSDTHFVAGDVVDGSAELTIGHPAAIGTDFADAAGTVLLATPTNGDGTDELSGIWFLALPGPIASLDLPELPAGWKYEGWAVIDGIPVTSGTFLDTEAADDAAPFSGPEAGPPFPGEDFLVNAPEGVTLPTDLSGATIVISVEPDPDDSPEPFILKPLVGQAADPATDHESYELANNALDLPRGTANLG